MTKRKPSEAFKSRYGLRRYIDCAPGTKWCSMCEQVKPYADFYRNKTNKDGYHARCKQCHTEEMKRCRLDPDYARYIVLKSSFGITRSDYEKMLAAQASVCAICGKPETAKGRRNLAVDHDHKTGLVRGLLCGRCNKGLGGFLDSPELLASAIEYLNRSRSVSDRSA